MDIIGYNKDAFVRITSRDDIDMGVFKGYSDIVVVKENVGLENQHYHAYVKGVNFETLKKRIARRYTGGNPVQSCKLVKEPEMQLRYLFKGDSITKLPCVVMNTLVKDVSGKQKEYYEEIEKAAIVRKAKKKKGVGLKEELLEYVKMVYPDRAIVTISEIVVQLVRICKLQDRLPPSDFLAVSYVEYVQMMLSETSLHKFQENKIRRIEEKMSCRQIC